MTRLDPDKIPIRPERMEMFSSGNISITADRLLMINDGELVGRSYSIWLKKPTDWTPKIRAEMDSFCVWPLHPQIRDMNMLC